MSDSLARQDGTRLVARPDTTNTAARVGADTACRSKTTEASLADNATRSCIHRKKPWGRPMPRRTSRANAVKSAVRSAVEHMFARQKGPIAMFVRTMNIARAATKLSLVNLPYKMQRLIWLDRKIGPA